MTREEKKLPEGLDEVADKYAHSLGYDEEKERLEITSAKEDFIAGAEYQRKQDQSLIELAKDLVDAVEKYTRQECLRSELMIKKDKLKELIKDK